MSDTAPAPDAKPQKSNKMLFIIIAAVVVLGGVGGGYFFMAKKSAANAKEEASKKPKDKKNDDEETSSKDGEEKASTDAKEGDKPGGSKFKLELPDDKDVKKVIALEPFVVNLADSNEPRYLRMSVSIGIGETKEEKTDPLLTTRVRNAILAVLTTKSSTEVLTPEGKSQLRKELLKAARKSVEEPRIEAIYITDFIIQM